MNKTVILSTNDNPDYLNYLSYVQLAWNKLGWNTLTFYLGNTEIESTEQNKIIKIDRIEGYRNETIVQVVRLFGYKYCDGLIMTSDIDMMPLSNYWNPAQDKITCYGYDLTGYTQFPICYIAANKDNWNKLIPESELKELLNKLINAKSTDFYEWWGVDQEIITQRIKSAQNILSIERGKDGILAQGRIDRYDWEGTKNKEGIKIDAHLPRPFNEIEVQYLINKYHA